MEERLLAVPATAKPLLAKVVRDFVASRIEKQIVAHAVEVAWQFANSRPAAHATADDRHRQVVVTSPSTTSQGVRT